MKYTAIVASVILSALALLGSSNVTLAQSDCKTLVKASPFGPDDQTGATNRITPAVTKAAAAEIQTGAVIPLAYNLVDGVPLFGTRFTKTILTTVALVPGAEFGKNKLTYMEDTYLSQSHVGTHIDGMGHIGIQDCYYNQTPMGKFVTQNGIKKLGLENLKTFATRGVVLDMVKVFQEAGKLKTNAACRTPCLDGGTVISTADIQAGLKMYNVTLREGDAVFVHTGWGDLFNQFPAQNTAYNASEPGIGKAAAQWLADQRRGCHGSLPRPRAVADGQRHPHRRERSYRSDRRRRGEQQTRDLLPLDDRPEGGGHHRHLYQYRSYQVVYLQRILPNATLRRRFK